MSLSNFKVLNFRNLSEVQLDFSQEINIFHGENGSGKTSLLEAIYHLGMGRSFRTRFSDRVIQDGAEKFSVYGDIAGIPTGIERSLANKLIVRLNKRKITSISQLVDQFPIQLINPHIHQLIDGSPKIRRQFVDWGVFHVEQKDVFLPFWKRYQRIVKQRNAALRTRSLAKSQITAWDLEFYEVAEHVCQLRASYISQFKPIFIQLIQEFLEIEEIEMEFYPGWNVKKPFNEVLQESLESDIKQGYTQYGPQRADLSIHINHFPAQDLLSRGQQKLLACAMRLAQAILLEKLIKKKIIFLIDDLPSELDEKKQEIFCEILSRLNAQIFVTSLDLNIFNERFKGKEVKMFHVEQGVIRNRSFKPEF